MARSALIGVIVRSLAAIGLVGAWATTSLAQDLTPIGTVQFRWRERGLGMVPNIGGIQATSLESGTPAALPNAAGNPTLTSDATFHLILEAFVVNTASGPNQARGFAGGTFNMLSTDLRSRASFAGSNGVGEPPDPLQFRNLAIASVAASGLTLPPGQTLLPNQPIGPNNHGVFAPFRAVADIAGSLDTASVGVQNRNPGATASMDAIVTGLDDAGLFTRGPSADPDTGEPIPASPYYQQYQYTGFNAWVPIFYVIFNITDVATQRDVDVKPEVFPVTEQDSGLRGWRGLTNTAILGDKWQLSLAAPLPTFRITVPAPGTGACLIFCGLMVARRRR